MTVVALRQSTELTQDKLTQLQDLRCSPMTAGGRYSSIYYWAMCIAISAYIGLKPDDFADDVHYLADAIRKEGCA